MAQIDSSIYGQFAPKVKSVADYDAEALAQESGQLNVLRSRQAADEYTRKVNQENVLRTFKQGLAGKTREEQITASRDAGHTDLANTMEDAYTKQRTGEAEIGLKTAQGDKTKLEMRIKAHDFSAQEATAVRSPQEAVEWAKRSFAAGAFGDPNDPQTVAAVQQKIAQLGQMQTPQQLEEWRAGAVKAGTDIKTQLEAQHRQVTAAETNRHNRSTEGLTARGQDLSASTARRGQDLSQAASNGAVTYQQDANGNYVALPTKPGAGPVTPRQVLGADGQPLKGKPGKASAMSATAQKELFEAEDGIAAANNVITLLTEAGKLNDKAYSGLGANLRSKVVSNLGGTESADATVNLDNLMTGQALESLKATFGGMPTEGERKILLEIQASTDKTPSQRKVIIDRAVDMAKRRVALNTGKAKSLREGSYFSDQGGPSGATPAANTRQLPGGFELVD